MMSQFRPRVREIKDGLRREKGNSLHRGEDLDTHAESKKIGRRRLTHACGFAAIKGFEASAIDAIIVCEKDEWGSRWRR